MTHEKPLPAMKNDCAKEMAVKRDDAANLLAMIEAVEPSDKAKLDEIDARVWCFVKGEEYAGKTGQFYYYKNNVTPELVPNFRISNTTGDWPDIPMYTRSRDALKSVRPEGWAVMFRASYDEVSGPAKYQYIAEKLPMFDIEILSAWLPTEELAELHAIIQAIEYERKARP